MSRRRVIWSVIAAVTLIVIGMGAFVSVRLLGGDEPAEAALTSPSGVASQTGSSAGSSGSAEGTWSVDTTTGSLDDGSATFAGYRIDEEVAGIGADTAVGRTRDVAGELGIEGTSITSLSVEVDMSTLESDDDRRDDQPRMRGLETDTYPTATFVLTETVSFDDEPQEGETVHCGGRWRPHDPRRDARGHGAGRGSMDRRRDRGRCDVRCGAVRLRDRGTDRFPRAVGRRPGHCGAPPALRAGVVRAVGEGGRRYIASAIWEEST
jgi:polyisoprenoid-binding protein YceI